MDPLELLKTACEPATSYVTDKLKEWIAYVIEYDQNLKTVKELHGRLEFRRGDIEDRIKEGERNSEEVLNEVKQWQEEVQKLLSLESQGKDWEELLMDDEARKTAEKCCFGYVGWNPKYRHDLSQKAKEKAEAVKAMMERIKDVGSNLTLPMAPPALKVSPRDFCEGLISREEKVQQVMAILRSDDVNRAGIYGMGGSGKTTLVGEIARLAESEKLFCEIVIAEISQFPNIKEIQDRIADRIGLRTLNVVHSVEERALTLYRRFKKLKSRNDTDHDGANVDQVEQRGRLLIILDNLWDKFDLSLLGIYPELQKDLGCKVLLTSRSKDVCKVMDVVEEHIFHISDLHPDEARLLFKKRVGEDIFERKGYKDIANELLENCPRLPLSISVLADMLKNQSFDVWKDTVEELKKPVTIDPEGFLQGTYSILEISYTYLRNEEKKKFFLLCCLFPFSSRILLTDLLRYGVGLGLFQYANSLVDATRQAYRWANELWSLSLLLEVDIERGEIAIHDDVKEAGKFFVAKGDHPFHVGAIPRWLKTETCRKYAAISMVSDNNYEYLTGLDLPKLQLLRLLGVSSSKLGDEYFSGMQNVKVLDLSKSDFECFPSSIECLSNVETLLLDNCCVKDISLICNLVKVQVLSLRGCSITKLSKEASNLVNLKLLDLTDCDKLEEIPSGVFINLTQLEGLYMTNSFNDWQIDGHMTSLSELESLPLLQVLEVEIKSIEQLPKGDFSIHNISSFKILLGEPSMEKDTSCSWDLQVRGIHASHFLKKGWTALLKKTKSLCLTDIHDLGVHMEGKFLSNLLSNLQELKVERLSGLEYLLPIQNAMKLKVLNVKDCCDLKYIFLIPTSMDLEEASDTRDTEIELPLLEEVEMKDLQLLEGLCSRGMPTFGDAVNTCNTLFTKKIMFPALEKLLLNSIGNIEEVWDIKTGEEFIKALPKLQSLSLENMDRLKHVWDKELCVGSFTFPCLKELVIKGCSNLETLCPPVVANGLQQLRFLEIKNCGSMVQVISTEDEGEARSITKQAISFPRLLRLYIEFSSNLKCFYSGSLRMEFTALNLLALRGLGTFETFARLDQIPNIDATEAGIQGDGQFQSTTLFLCDMVLFPSLKGFGVHGLDKVEIFWDIATDDEFATKFPKLEKMYIYNMAKLRHVSGGGVHSLGSVKYVSICYCYLLESFFSSPPGFPFPPQPENIICRSLLRLNLKMIPRITVLFKLVNGKKITNDTGGKVNGNEGQSTKEEVVLFYCNVELPSLEELVVSEMPNLESIICNTDQEEEASSGSAIMFPEMRTLYLKDLPLLKCKQSHTVFKNLSCLYISNLINLRCLFSSVPGSPHDVLFRSFSVLGNLQELTIKDCDSLEELFQVEDNITTLKLLALQRLKMSRLCKLKHISWHVLPNLQSLRLTQCLEGHKYLIQADLVASGSIVLQQLEYLKIKRCDDMEAIVYEQAEHDNVEMATKNVVTFSLLKEIKLVDLPLFIAFSMPDFDLRLPSLESVQIRCCYSVIQFSAGNLTAPKLSNVEIDMNPIVVDQELNKTLLNYFKDYQMEVANWPKTLKHKLHQEHELKLVKTVRNEYNCDVCQQAGDIYAFCCRSCKFFLHPTCALVENQLIEEPDEVKLAKVWPKILNYKLHDRHQLKLVMGKLTRCIACEDPIQFYSYHCHECTFDMHPHCILLEMLDNVQDTDHKATDPDHSKSATETSSSLTPTIKYWPKTIKHKLHEEHDLQLAIMRGYICDDCKRKGQGYSYCCRVCDFDLHPVCGFKENQLMDEPDEMKVAKDWPRVLLLSEHREHELQLVMGRVTYCARCTKNLELFSYHCWQCKFDLHPKCAFEFSEAERIATVRVADHGIETYETNSTFLEELVPLRPAIKRTPLLIGGCFVESQSHQGIHVIDPATQNILCEVPLATAEEFKAAVCAAGEAYQLWRDTSVITRQYIMLKFRRLIWANIDKLALIITEEQGMTRVDAKEEILFGIELIEHACRYASSEKSETISFSHNQEPLGVCAGISPPDFPALIPIWMLSVAIMCGNTFILKPSEKTPGPSVFLAKLAMDAGFPNGVFSIIHGTNNIINAICDDDDIRAVSFVGSSGAGMHINRRSSVKGKRVQCYVWAKNHAIVMPDAHSDVTTWSVFTWNVFTDAGFTLGQSRIPLGRIIFVGESRERESELVEFSRGIGVNAGNIKNAFVGPVTSKQDKERVSNYIQSALEAGAELLLDGRDIVVSGYERGNFLGPTIISDVNPFMECYKEDIVGPVLLFMRVNNLEEAIDIVNNDKKSKSATIFTLDDTTVRKFQCEVKVGQVGINRFPTKFLPFSLFVGQSTSVAADNIDSYVEGAAEFYTQQKNNSDVQQQKDPPGGGASPQIPPSELASVLQNES